MVFTVNYYCELISFKYINPDQQVFSKTSFRNYLHIQFNLVPTIVLIYFLTNIFLKKVKSIF